MRPWQKEPWKPPHVSTLPKMKPLVEKVPPLSQVERLISEEFDPLDSDPARRLAGQIVRSAVNIARYQRSKNSESEHHASMIRAASTFAIVGVRLACETPQGLETVSRVSEIIREVSWEKAPDVPRPLINTTFPYDSTEAPYTLIFQQSSNNERQDLPA